MTRILLCVVLACAACVTAERSARAQSVVETDQTHVASCKPLGQVTGSNPGGGMLAPSGFAAAKSRALDAAGALGATHVVWLESGVENASAIAYLCER